MSYILLLILPYDIVEYIDNINKQRKACAIIINSYKNHIDRNFALKFIVKMIIIDACHFYDVKDDIEFNLYKYLKIICEAQFNREKYDHYFWQCFLHMLSKTLMYFYYTVAIYHNIYDVKRKNNIYYINLKKSIKLWFLLCNKYNIKLAFIFKKNILSGQHNEFIYTKARNILKINNFNKFLYAPYVVDNEDFFIENNFATNYLRTVTRA